MIILQRVSTFLLLGISVLTSGCVVDIWDNYAMTQYGRERAERVCHPYSHCSQGVWIAKASIEQDPTETYNQCVEMNMRRENGWLKDTVSLGLEVNHCMNARGYQLVQD